jgi:hypothetical protein
MDGAFFSWLATQSYSIEVAIGAFFVVIIAPAVLAGIAVLATWVEQLTGDVLRMSGLLNPLERGRKNLWRLQGSLPGQREPAATADKQRPRAAG